MCSLGRHQTLKIVPFHIGLTNKIKGLLSPTYSINGTILKGNMLKGRGNSKLEHQASKKMLVRAAYGCGHNHSALGYSVSKIDNNAHPVILNCTYN